MKRITTVFAISLSFAFSPSVSGENFIMDKSKLNQNLSFLAESDLTWNEMKDTLARYPMKIQIPAKRKIMVQRSRSMMPLLGDNIAPQAPVASDNSGVMPWPNSAVDTNTVRFDIQIGNDAEAILHEFVPLAISQLIRSSQPSTVYGVRPLSIPGASFVSHYMGGSDLSYCIYNVAVIMTGKLNTNAVGRFNALFADNDGSMQKRNDITYRQAEPDDLKLTLITRSAETRAVIVRWHASDNAFKNHWIRMDSTAGQLSILSNKEQTVTVEEVPIGSTTIHLYTISPNGKQWHYTSLEVAGFDEQAGKKKK